MKDDESLNSLRDTFNKELDKNHDGVLDNVSDKKRQDKSSYDFIFTSMQLESKEKWHF